MSLFGKSKSQSFLGIDVGVHGMKLVEMQNEHGRAKLMTYAYSERGLEEQSKSLLDNPQVAANLLSTIVKKSGATTTRAVSGLPQNAVFSAIVTVPKLKDPRQMKPLIEGQVAKLTPIPVTEMILDSKVIDEEKLKTPEEKKEEKKAPPVDPKKGELVRVLVTGAAKTLVQKYVEVFKLAKIELVALETESFALIRALVGRDRSTILIIDMGAMRTNMTIVERGIPIFTRSVNVGGGQLTKTIAEQMGISLADAEQMKVDLSKGQVDGVPPQVELILQPILTEINYSFGEFKRLEADSAKRVEKIIITGGSANLPGMVTYLSQKLNINTYVGDPWARVQLPQALRPVLDEIGPRFAVSIGLAMRDME